MGKIKKDFCLDFSDHHSRSGRPHQQLGPLQSRAGHSDHLDSLDADQRPRERAVVRRQQETLQLQQPRQEVEEGDR